MKQKITTFIFVFSALLSSFIAKADDKKSLPSEKLLGATTLVINARVNIVLVNSSSPILEVVGKTALQSRVTFERNGNTLTINADKYKDLRNAGVIYISANEFKKIHVNNQSELRSLNMLENASLDVHINSECQFTIHNVGALNIIPNAGFSVEETREERMIPKNVFIRSKKYAF